MGLTSEVCVWLSKISISSFVSVGIFFSDSASVFMSRTVFITSFHCSFVFSQTSLGFTYVILSSLNIFIIVAECPPQAQESPALQEFSLEAPIRKKMETCLPRISRPEMLSFPSLRCLVRECLSCIWCWLLAYV